MPLQTDVTALMRHWPMFYARSIGCVGVLKTWLLRAMVATLDEGGEELTWERVQAYAFPEAECDQMALEATEGEQALVEADQYREQLWRRLHLDGVRMPNAAAKKDTPVTGELAQIPSGGVPPPADHPDAVARSPRTGRRLPGQRNPSRDPVGGNQPAVKPVKCSFAGTLELEFAQLTQAATMKVECPACGAIRTIHLQGSRAAFPTHPPRLTRTPGTSSRWIKQENGWVLALPGLEEARSPQHDATRE